MFCAAHSVPAKIAKLSWCLVGLILGMGTATRVAAATVDATWDGGAGTPLWSDATNWNPDGVPSNTATDFYNVTIGRGFTVDINNNDVTIDRLILTPGSDAIQNVNVGNSRTLTVVQDAARAGSGQIVLHGFLNLNATGAGVAILDVSGNVTVTGSSVLRLGNSFQNRIGGSGSLTNNLTYIEGAGQIGMNDIALTRL
jgi:hypothetical protein